MIQPWTASLIKHKEALYKKKQKTSLTTINYGGK